MTLVQESRNTQADATQTVKSIINTLDDTAKTIHTRRSEACQAIISYLSSEGANFKSLMSAYSEQVKYVYPKPPILQQYLVKNLELDQYRDVIEKAVLKEPKLCGLEDKLSATEAKELATKVVEVYKLLTREKDKEKLVEFVKNNSAQLEQINTLFESFLRPNYIPAHTHLLQSLFHALGSETYASMMSDIAFANTKKANELVAVMVGFIDSTKGLGTDEEALFRILKDENKVKVLRENSLFFSQNFALIYDPSGKISTIEGVLQAELNTEQYALAIGYLHEKPDVKLLARGVWSALDGYINDDEKTAKELVELVIEKHPDDISNLLKAFNELSENTRRVSLTQYLESEGVTLKDGFMERLKNEQTKNNSSPSPQTGVALNRTEDNLVSLNDLKLPTV